MIRELISPLAILSRKPLHRWISLSLRCTSVRVLHEILDDLNMFLVNFVQVLNSYHGLVPPLEIPCNRCFLWLVRLNTYLGLCHHGNFQTLGFDWLNLPSKFGQETSLGTIDHRIEQVSIDLVTIMSLISTGLLFWHQTDIRLWKLA